MAEKPWTWLVTCLLWTGPVLGMSVVPQVDCPTQFRAIASEVREPLDSDGPLAKQTIVFSVEQALKGKVQAREELAVELLKYGPVKVEAGQEYVVQLNQGKLCWIESAH